MQPTESSLPAVVPLGDNPVLLWDMTAHERLRRIAAARKLPFADVAPDSNDTSDTVILSNLAFVAIVDASAVAGFVGGGGLGFFAQSYGFGSFDTVVTWATVLIIVAIVQLGQLLGNVLARRVLRR